MKLLFATTVVFAFCMLFVIGSAEDETATPGSSLPVDADNLASARIFFGSGDPCTNSFYTFLNIADAKCSLQCFIQAGLQQGGYCDESGVCQCNQV